ncbi:hypothetical protein K493DRAFT_313678 [Basidiobolus meristosporus CBS 931.73]|uniref:F-box domain-containing protein n=1 Tax=Basidiobolus meristosporus CBS 931.73 TaxID=1314790 RepID=A0A1Y1YK30_9FUNG|nr:hypothetical protein K493DRAFT_313678 [Basidiobolus meristosporus CBS 931.73]|eukprot:ORX98342.1 hypothetical protein K493DRAFT_313678 [Basidiobolus meristosporus CBS 931.73]
MELLNTEILERVFSYLGHPPRYATVCRTFHHISQNPIVRVESYYNEYGVHGLWQVAKRHLPFLTHEIYTRLLERGVEDDVWFYQVYAHEVIISQINKSRSDCPALPWSDVALILEQGLLKHEEDELNRDCLMTYQLLKPFQQLNCPSVEKTVSLLAHYRILPTYRSLWHTFSLAVYNRLSLSRSIGGFMLHLISTRAPVVEMMIQHQVYLDALDPHITCALLANEYEESQERHTLLSDLQKIGLCKELSESTLLDVFTYFASHDGLAQILRIIQENWPTALENRDLSEITKCAIQEMFASPNAWWNDTSMEILLTKIPDSQQFLHDLVVGRLRRRKMEKALNETEHGFLEKFDELLGEESPDAEMVGFFVSVALWQDRTLPLIQFLDITDPEILDSFGRSMEEFIRGVLPTTFQVKSTILERDRVRWLSKLLELWKSDFLGTCPLSSSRVDCDSDLPYIPSTQFHRQLLRVLKSTYSRELVAKFENYLPPTMVKVWEDTTRVTSH